MNISRLLIGVVLLLLSQITWGEVAKISDIDALKNIQIDNTIRFQYIGLDKGITILPTDKQLKQQRDHIESRRVGESSSFNEGVISLTAHIAPGQVARKNVPLQFCIKVDDFSCKDILVWNSQQRNFVKNLTIDNIPTNTEASVHISLLLSDEVVSLLRPNVTNSPASYQIFAKSSKYLKNSLQARSSHQLAPKMNVTTEMASVYLVDINDKNTRSHQRKFNGASYEMFEKSFKKGFKNKHFGLNIILDAAASVYFRKLDNNDKNEKDENYEKCKAVNASLSKATKNLEYLKLEVPDTTDKEKFDAHLEKIKSYEADIKKIKNQLKELNCPNNKTWAAGSKLDANAGLDMFLLGNDIKKLIYANLWANIDTFTRTPYFEVSMKALDKEIFWKAWEFKKEKNDKKFKLHVTTDRLSDPLDGLDKIKSFKDIKEGLNEGVDLRMDIKDVLKYKLKKSKTNYYLIGVIPVRVQAGVFGSITSNGTVGAYLQANKKDFNLVMYAKEIGPKLDFGATADAGVSLVVITAGVDLKLTVLSNLFGIDAGFDIVKMFDKKNIKEFANISIFNEIEGPKGSIGLFIEYPKFTWDGWTPTFKQVTERDVLVDWSTYKKRYSLYQVGNSDIPSTLEDFQKDITGSSSVISVKVIKGSSIEKNSWTPPAGGNWVCLYDARLDASKQPRGNGYCFPITADDVLKQGKFANLSLGEALSLGEKVSLSGLGSIKIFTDTKGLRLAAYTGKKYSGNKITYIAHGAEAFNIDSDFTARSITISRPLEKKSGSHSYKYCLYQDKNSDDKARHLCLSESKNILKTEYLYRNQVSSIKVFDTTVEIKDIPTKQFQRWYLDEGEWDTANLPLLNNILDIVEVDKSSAPYISPREVAVRGAPGDWGKWASSTSYCPTGQYVKNITLKVEKPQDGDDTALNGITLWCDAPGYNGADFGGELNSKRGPWGDEQGWNLNVVGNAGGCITSNGVNTMADRVKVNIMKQQGGDSDDFGMTHATIGCTSDSVTDWLPTKGPFDTYGYEITKSVLQCPKQTAVCGFKTRVEGNQGDGDDTALNGITISCCQK